MPRKPLLKRKIEEWIEEQEGKLLSTTTIKVYWYNLMTFYRFMKENGHPLHPLKITGKHLREYWESMEDQALATQRNKMRQVKSFLEWCGNQEVKKIRINIRPERTRVQWFTEEEIANLLMAASEPIEKAVMTILVYTARRRNAVANLKTKDVAEREIRFKDKGKKEHRIPVGREFWAEMTPYLIYRQNLVRKYGEQKYFLIYEYGGRLKRMTSKTLYNIVLRCGKRIGMHVTPHDIRRSVLTHMYLRGCPPKQLQYFAGHQSVEQTMRYIGIDQYDIVQAVNSYHPGYIGVQKTEKMYLSR